MDNFGNHELNHNNTYKLMVCKWTYNNNNCLIYLYFMQVGLEFWHKRTRASGRFLPILVVLQNVQDNFEPHQYHLQITVWSSPSVTVVDTFSFTSNDSIEAIVLHININFIVQIVCRVSVGLTPLVLSVIIDRYCTSSGIC